HPTLLEYGVSRLSRVLRKPPKIVWQRMLTELTAETDRFRAGRRARAFDTGALCDLMQCDSIADIWLRLSARLHATPIPVMTERDYERSCPGDARRIFAAAEQALAHRVDLLGTGPVHVGSP